MPSMVCIEPRGGNQDDFDPVLKGYYDSIRHGTKPVIGKKRRGKRLGVNNRTAMECTETSTKGAAFLAVCRGKVFNFFFFFLSIVMYL